MIERLLAEIVAGAAARALARRGLTRAELVLAEAGLRWSCAWVVSLDASEGSVSL